MTKIYNTPWAIVPDGLSEMARSIDKFATENTLFGDFIQEYHDKSLLSSIRDAVGTLSITGVLTHKTNWGTVALNGVSTEQIERDFDSLIENSTIEKIILVIDSPGGEVDGILPLAEKIFESRGKKEIIALVNPVAASAAYWLASAASKVYISSATDTVGSIGVVTMHVDYSVLMEEKLGIKTTEIYAGKYKRIAGAFKPLSVEGKAVLQERVDYLYSLFVNQVARNRGTEASVLHENFADGRVFTGEQAIQGLVDGIKDMKSLTEEKEKKEVFLMPGDAITLEFLETKESALLESIRAASLEDGMKKGASAERQRIIKIQALSQPGFEEIISLAIANGDEPGTAALAIIREQKSRGPAATLKAIEKDSQTVDIVPTATTEEQNKEEEKKKAIANMVSAGNRATAIEKEEK